MKLFTFPRIALAFLLTLVALFAAPAVGACAFALPLISLLNFAPLATHLLGTSYPVLNVTTSTNLDPAGDNATKARTEMWVRRAVQGADYAYQDNPLADNFMGRMVQGEAPDDSQLRKAVLMITDTNVLEGNTVHITTYAPFGGEGTQGEGVRTGTGQKFHQGNFDVKIGRFHLCVGFTSIASSETLLGSRQDKMINDALKALHARKRSDDMLMALRTAAGEEGLGPNNMLPNGIATIATLKTANVLDTVLISNMNDELPSLGALPMDTTNDSGGSYGDLFTLLSPDKGMRNLQAETVYLEGLKNAGVRGSENPIFKGGFERWNGVGLYRWIHRNHAAKGPIGSPLLPIAKLGYALTAADTGSIVHGGGLACGATVDNSNADATNTGDTTDGGLAPQWFKYFRAAPWTYHNGDTIAATTGTTRYLRIDNNDGTGSGVYSYKINNGKAIIIFARVVVSGATQRTHPVGSLISECTVLGQSFCRHVMFGQQALVCGLGRIDGTPVDPKLGLRTEEVTNHGAHHEVGVEAVWGCAAVKRAVDSAYPNFMLATTAWQPTGAPTIS